MDRHRGEGHQRPQHQPTSRPVLMAADGSQAKPEDQHNGRHDGEEQGQAALHQRLHVVIVGMIDDHAGVESIAAVQDVDKLIGAVTRPPQGEIPHQGQGPGPDDEAPTSTHQTLLEGPQPRHDPVVAEPGHQAHHGHQG